MKTWNLLLVVLLANGVALAADPAAAKKPKPAAPAKPAAEASSAAGVKAAGDAKPADVKPAAVTTTAADAKAAEPAPPKPKEKEQADLGMSILGNQEAPKALVIVPWKSSELGDSLGIATVLDDSRLPIDKEVFMRALSYYEIRSGTTRHDGAQPASAGQGRK